MRLRSLTKPLAALVAFTALAAPQGGDPPPLPPPEPGAIVTEVAEPSLPARLGAQEIAFYGVSGLTVDPRNGSLYLLDKARSLVFRVEPGGGAAVPFAGAQISGFNGDGLPARETWLHVPSALALDRRAGELLVADTHNYRVRAIPLDGSRVYTVAGQGIRGLPPDQLPTEAPTPEGLAVGHWSGDGGPATEAELNLPAGLAVDDAGILFVADSGNHRIRAVNRGTAPVRVMGVEIGPGRIATLAGTGELGFSGDGGPARAARLAYPTELQVDGAGNLLLVDTFNQRLRRIDRRSGVIQTVARGALPELPAAQALERWSLSTVGLTVTATGEILYTDRVDRSLHRLSPGGEERTLYTAPPREAGLGDVAAGPHGEIYVADVYHNRVLRVEGGGARTYAGGARAPRRCATGAADFSILGPVAVDRHGALYLADVFHYAVRRIDLKAGTIEAFLGNGELGTGGDGGPPELAQLVHPTDILIDGDRGFYVSDQYANLVRQVVLTPGQARVETLAGSRQKATEGDGAAARETRLGQPLSLALHPLTGEIYIGCHDTHSIRKVGADGRIATVAGTGENGFAGEGTPARTARFTWPAALAFDRQGSLYVSDLLNHRIRRITPDGTISTYAGTGRRGFSGDGGPATAAALDGPGGLAFDGDGNLYFADTNNHRVRRILRAGRQPRIETVAGTGRRGFSGDGGPARAAALNLPRGIAFGPDGTLYIVDSFNRRLRAVKFSR